MLISSQSVAFTACTPPLLCVYVSVLPHCHTAYGAGYFNVPRTRLHF
nr:MAG TPA: hypothetical protein [Caudoviricetes sp.]